MALSLVAAPSVTSSASLAEQMRGSKLLWRILCMNALGAVGYFRWGRRAASR